MRQSLTGADNFQLLLDRHMRKRGPVGNVVRLELRLDPLSDLRVIKHSILANATFRTAVAMRMKRVTLVMPKWVRVASVEAADHITIHDSCSEERFAASVLCRDLSIATGPVHIDLVVFSDGRKSAVLSAHHALFDQRGMMNLAQALGEREEHWPVDDLFPEPYAEGWLKEFANTVFIMFYMLGSPFWFMARLLRGRPGPVSVPRFRVLQLAPEAVQAVERCALTAGARFGKSPFHLAATLGALLNLFQARRERPPYFWLSMPVSKRRKGGRGHLFSNNLSFVFVRLSADQVRPQAYAVRHINAQIKKQVVEGIPARYISLLDFFRRVPLWLYSTLVNLPMRGDYASLSFSDLGEERDVVTTFAGARVLQTVDYASVPAPPGLTVTFKTNKDGLQIVIGSVPEAMSNLELHQFERDLVALLTTHA